MAGTRLFRNSSTTPTTTSSIRDTSSSSTSQFNSSNAAAHHRKPPRFAAKRTTPVHTPGYRPTTAAVLEEESLESPFLPHLSILADLSLSPPPPPPPPSATGAAAFQHSSSFSFEADNRSTADAEGGVSGKTCLPSTAALLDKWRLNHRRIKIASIDVASVGNASDTLVPVSVAFASAHASSPVSGRDLHESAKSYLNQGNYKRALENFEAILIAQVQRFGPLHPSVGAAMHNVGVCRQRMQQNELAENLFAEAVQIRQETLGRNHLEVAASLSKLGAARASLRKYDEAFDDLRQAISITQQQLGYEHKTMAQMLCHLACFYFEAGELFAAQATFMDAYRIYQRVWPNAEDRDACMAQMTDTLCNVGSIQNQRKRFANAITTFSEALDLQRGIFEPDHPRIVSTLDNLAFSYSKNKEYASALSCYQKMLKAQVSRSGTFTEACFETFRKQILMYEKLKKFDDAIKTTRSTLRLQESMLKNDDKIIRNTKEILAELAKSRKRRK